MGERTERAILNHLIETCLDAARGFELAAEQAETAALSERFLLLAQQRRRFANDLLPYAYRLGGPRVGDGTTAAALHRGWIQLKARLTSDPDRAVLREAERGERFAVAVFDDAVNDMLPPDVRDLVEAQDEDVHIAHDEIADDLRRSG